MAALQEDGVQGMKKPVPGNRRQRYMEQAFKDQFATSWFGCELMTLMALTTLWKRAPLSERT